MTILTAEQVNRARAAALADGLPRLHAIIHEVCKTMGVHVADVKSLSRNPKIDAARVQIYLCAHEAGFKAAAIARVMKRDSSTVSKVITRHSGEPE